MRVKAPNGLILDVPPHIATGLVGGRNSDFIFVDEGEPVAVTAPKPYASKPEWVGYAVSRGMPRDEAEALSKTVLIDRLA
jgi:hypothetical protein